ncbi:AEC family transporter [[Ruminococcus] lactaris]|uniref:AEC family transporter n=1 Tax=[Ruminococcus] lactaris TaxID=46228 RepID=UPI0032C05509
MENLIFSLNATVPIFLLMALGFLFRKLGWIDEVFASKMNQFVFLVPLPILVFEDLATVDFQEVWNLKFVLFCFFVTFASIALAAGISFLWKDREIRGEFIQASYRSSAALLGIAFIRNIYGDAGLAPLMIIGSMPLYNIMAVVVLSFFQPERRKLDKELWKKTLKGIVTNPIIIGIAAGLLWSALRIPMPYIIGKTVSNVGAVATPLGLMALGASFDVQKTIGKIKPVTAACVLKFVDFTTVFLPLAVMLGFRREELIAILVMLGSATTVSCYVMAKNMGHEGTVTSGVVMLTTVFSAFTLTGWLFLLKSRGLV